MVEGGEEFAGGRLPKLSSLIFAGREDLCTVAAGRRPGAQAHASAGDQAIRRVGPEESTVSEMVRLFWRWQSQRATDPDFPGH